LPLGAALAGMGWGHSALLAGVVLMLSLGWMIEICRGWHAPSGGFRHVIGSIAPWLIFLAVLIGAFAVLQHPEGRWDGENDDGLYANIAVHLARTGSTSVEAAAFEELPGSLRKLFAVKRPLQAQPGGEDLTQFWGPSLGAFFHDQSPFESDAQTSGSFHWSIQFPAGMPVWLAGWIALGGYGGAGFGAFLLLPVAAGLLAVMMRDWTGDGRGGLIAALFFLTNPLAVWLANTHYAELLTSVCWLSALLWLGRLTRYPFVGSLGVVCWCAAAACVKVEGLLLGIGTLFVAFLLHGREWKRSIGLGLGTVILLPVVVWGYGPVGWQNASDTLASFLSGKVMLAGLCGGLAVSIAWSLRRHLHWLNRVEVRWAMAGVCVLGFAWLGLIRPNLEGDHAFYYWPARGEILSWRAFTFPRLSWYQGTWGLLAICLGIALWMRWGGPWRKGSNGVGLAFLGAALAFGLVYFHDIRNNPIQPYAMRRLIPVVLPGLLVVATLGWRSIPGRRTVLRVVSICGLLTILAGQVFGLIWLGRERPDPFLPDQVAALAEQLPADGIYVLGPEASRTAVPLRCLGKREVLVAKGRMHETSMLLAVRRLGRHAEQNGRALYWLRFERAQPGDRADWEATYRKHESESRPRGMHLERFEVTVLPISSRFHPRNAVPRGEPADSEDRAESSHAIAEGVELAATSSRPTWRADRMLLKLSRSTVAGLRLTDWVRYSR